MELLLLDRLCAVLELLLLLDERSNVLELVLELDELDEFELFMWSAIGLCWSFPRSTCCC